MLTVTYTSPLDGTTKTISFGCGGTMGGAYTFRQESTRSTIKKYVSSSALTTVPYKVTTERYYDVNTGFLTDVEASSFATDFMLAKTVSITSEDFTTATAAYIETSSAPVQTNCVNGVNYYSFVIHVSTPAVQW